MTDFSYPISIRWSDLDPNFHLRHSAYYDFGAQARVELLNRAGLTAAVMQQHGFGPILFREECVFRREIRYGDKVTIDVKVKSLRKDHSRFSMRHELKRDDGTVCAIITIDGAWIDTRVRKLAAPPPSAVAALDDFPKTDDFQWSG
jgi:acyl-CoA thioester hydrolase